MGVKQGTALHSKLHYSPRTISQHHSLAPTPCTPPLLCPPPGLQSSVYPVPLFQTSLRPPPQVLTDELPALVGGLSFKKSMRWSPGTGAASPAFSRPLRWLLALHGDTVLPFVYGTLQVGVEPWVGNRGCGCTVLMCGIWIQLEGFCALGNRGEKGQ